MNARIIATSLFVVLIGMTSPVTCQTWIGEAFELDTTVTPAFSLFPSDCFHLCFHFQGNILFFTDQKAFQNGGNDYAAHICALSLQDYSTFEFDLPFPNITPNKDLLAKTFWIKDFCFSENLCAISVQDHIILYRKKKDHVFEYDTILDHPNVKAVYLYHENIYYLEEDHDIGYKWFCFVPSNQRETMIRTLPYEAPHVVQASPNRHLFHDENNMYFLSTRYPILSKYNLDGSWVQDIRFDLPDWHPFDDEYIQKSLQVPYGIERIFATKGEIFNYSYPKMVFPIQDQYLIYYTQYDSVSGKSTPMFAISDSAGHVTLYNRKCPSNQIFSEKIFPFNLLQPYEDLGRTSWGDKLVEITADCNIEWEGLTYDDYHKLKESFFRKHEPIFKIRIMRLKDENIETQLFFYNSQLEPLSLSQLPKGKHLFILHDELECSACSNYLLQAMNGLDSEHLHLGILYAFIPGALQEREINRSVRQYLDRPYDSYYLATGKPARYPRYISEKVRHFPAFLFYESGKAPILFSNEQIFADDPYTFRFSPEFQEALDNFTTKSMEGH